MFFVVARLVCVDCWNVGGCYFVRRLDVKLWETSLMVELFKALGLAFLMGCALVIGPLVLQLHVQHLEIEQHRMMQELEAENVRLPELRP